MLIDANIFKGYFQAQIEKPHSLCGCPISLFREASASTPIYHDPDKIIEHEWMSVVDREWFDAWLSANLLNGTISYLPATYSPSLEKKLASQGFPKGRDIIYVRIALTEASRTGSSTFYTEDMDFYDPTKKTGSSKTRLKILKASSGPVCKLLQKSSIIIQCVP